MGLFRAGALVLALLVLAGPTVAVDVVAWEPDSTCVGSPVAMTLDNSSGPRCGLEFTIRFDPDTLAVDSIRTVGRAVGLRGSAFRVVTPGTLVGVLFDDVGADSLASGGGPIVEVFFNVNYNYTGYRPVTFEEVIIADAAMQPVQVSGLALQICWVGVAVSELAAEQQEDGSIAVSWFVGPDQEIIGFNVLRARGADDRYVKVNHEPVNGTGRITFVDSSDEAKLGGTFFYKLAVLESTGETTVIGPVQVVARDLMIPVRFALYQNIPNPALGSTMFRYDVPRAQQVEIKLYDVAGRLVRTLVAGRQQPGRLQVVWDRTSGSGRRVASGIYFVRMKTPGFVASRKVVVR